MAATNEIDRLPPIVPPIGATRMDWRRDVRPGAAFSWLAAGWKDFTTRPGLSLAYGALVFVISVLTVGGLFRFGYDYVLFPALSGFLVVGPLIATGLYEKSRRLVQGLPLTLPSMMFVKARSGGQILFVGVLLCLLMLLWMRAAVLLYALFFGLLPFPGLNEVVGILITTSRGWALLIVGSLVGGLFAAFALAISVFGVPMLLAERTDALTAMGQSMALVWHNRPVMLTWGAIVVGSFVLSVATALIGLIVVFPVLGHATWHAYAAMRRKANCASE
jgi:uncharacterized membrane protein